MCLQNYVLRNEHANEESYRRAGKLGSSVVLPMLQLTHLSSPNSLLLLHFFLIVDVIKTPTSFLSLFRNHIEV